EGVVLTFINMVEDEDTLVGFDGTPWHSHGVMTFETGASTYTECDELEILVGLESGELLVLSEYLDGQLVDRSLIHRGVGPDLSAMEPGEEVRLLRVARAPRGAKR